MDGAPRAVTGSGNLVALSPSPGIASVESGAGLVLSSPEAGSVMESILQNWAASFSDISTYPSKCHWYGSAGVKHIAVSLSVMSAFWRGLHPGHVSLLQGLDGRRDSPSAWL